MPVNTVFCLYRYYLCLIVFSSLHTILTHFFGFHQCLAVTLLFYMDAQHSLN